jgi:PIN like domain
VNKPARPATVSFYVDADVLGLAKVLASIRSDVTYPGDPGGRAKGKTRPACPITRAATLDRVWIPETAKRGWIIITRDRHIQEHRAEIQAVRVSGARMVVLAGREAIDTFQQLEVLMCQWRRIAGLVPRPGPFIFRATRTSFIELRLGTEALTC